MGEYACYEGELDAAGMRFAIVAARFNRDITEPTSENIAYLRSKQDKLGHLLGFDPEHDAGAG